MVEFTNDFPEIGSDPFPHPDEKIPYCCPVCGGNGIVPRGFYMVTKGCSGMTSDASPEQCRSCNGTGIVWSA